ncbi:MAG: hypothetical protein ACYCVB_07520 [Bacilli bacterium]
MLLQTSVLKPGDILINDRGFLDRRTMNTLKIDRGMDTYVPVKKKMDIYPMAVSTAKEQDRWQRHPNTWATVMYRGALSKPRDGMSRWAMRD